MIAALSFLTFLSAPLVSQVSSGQATVPHLIKFGGNLVDVQGKSLTGTVGVTFSIYKNQTGGAPLWMEVQNVKADAKGQYVALLGSTKEDGLPLELFASGEAQWLGVRAENQEEQVRILLVSVPYALKAADADTFGGKPVSAFVQVPPTTETPSSSASTSDSRASHLNIRVAPNVGGSGTVNFIPIWTDNSGTLGNSTIFQSGSNIGFGTTTPVAKLSFGNTCCGVPVVHFFDNGTGTRFGAGINGAELQFFFPTPQGGHTSFNAGGDLQPSGTNEKMRISSTGTKINSGVDATGSGIKHVRSTASCTTGQNPGATCSVTVNWPGTPFADTRYTAVCTMETLQAPSNNPSGINISIPIAPRTTPSIRVDAQNTASNPVSINGLDCIPLHD